MRKGERGKKVVHGVLVKGYFPGGEEWVFIPDTVEESIFHSFLPETIAVYLRKRSFGGKLILIYNKEPTREFISDLFHCKMRLLKQDEILLFSEVYAEVKKKVHGTTSKRYAQIAQNF